MADRRQLHGTVEQLLPVTVPSVGFERQRLKDQFLGLPPLVRQGIGRQSRANQAGDDRSQNATHQTHANPANA